jgi:hypothetical protein
MNFVLGCKDGTAWDTSCFVLFCFAQGLFLMGFVYLTKFWRS